MITGKVTAVKPFGAFVDVGLGQHALIQVANISADRITAVDQIFAIGDTVKVLSRLPVTLAQPVLRPCAR